MAGKAKSTIYGRKHLLENLDKIKPIQEWTKDEIDLYLFELIQKQKPATVEYAKITLRSFFSFLGQPEKIKHIKRKTTECPIDRDDLLTDEEINAMIATTESPLYKALMAFLRESGARINEVLPIKVNDVMETDKGMIIKVHQTKFGVDKRDVLCYFSGQYIRNLITYLGLGKNDYLFRSRETPDKPLYYGTVERMFKKIGKKAGITKPCHPHTFRHACATDLVLQNYAPALIKKGLGWKPSSKAIDRYTHVVDEDFINARLQRLGGVVPKPDTPQEQKLKQADEIQIADDKTLLRRLAVENQELHKMKEEMELLKQAFGMVKTPEGNFTFEAQVKELPLNHPAAKKGKGFAVITDKELK